MENATGADGSFYLEDMTKYGDEFQFGFYNRGNVIGEIYFVVNHGENGEGTVLNVDFDVFYYQKGEYSVDVRCGTVTVSAEALYEALEGLNVEVETVSVVFVWGDVMSGYFDYETGYFEGSYLEEAITFIDYTENSGR